MSDTRKLFGTDGVRGRANVYPMTPEMALTLGQGVAAVFKSQAGRPKFVIAKDTRLSGYMLENALAAGICSLGGEVLLAGPLPTPAAAFLTRDLEADAGLVISASHNPFYDNGIKIFGGDGFKLPDEVETAIENYIFSQNLNHTSRPTGLEVGKARRIEDAADRYIAFLKQSFHGGDLSSLTLALDCAHGAAYKVAPRLFSELGANLKPLGVKPNGVNINDGVGALHPQALAELIHQGQAQLGLALDGDGDRLILVDEEGQIVDGDQIMAICADYLKRQGRLRNNTLVATVMSNLGLELCLKERGINMLRTKVGDRYVVEAMREGGYNLGGEQSGHLIFLDDNTTGDALTSALAVLSIMAETGRPLSELKNIMQILPQKLENLKVARQVPVHETTLLSAAIQRAVQRLGDQGRVLVRYSGTEALLRIMAEARDQKMLEDICAELKAAALRELGQG